MKKIFLVEDDYSYRYAIEKALINNGFSVIKASSVKEAKSLFTEQVDLAVFDIMLPDGNGFELHELYKVYGVPVIFLSALDDEMNVVTGLNIGAYDYITKPFYVSELIARINKIFYKNNEIKIITIGNLTINNDSMKVFVNNNEIILSSTEYKLLKYLIRNASKVVSREQILAEIWDSDGKYVNDNTVSVNIRRLREKIGDDKIKTIRGLGYVFMRNGDENAKR
ncbi:response regulator transcription factor [Mycoplasmatota bacterium]|nr:response regulator transcription factor [Mycoplasmatota bacterium]